MATATEAPEALAPALSSAPTDAPFCPPMTSEPEGLYEVVDGAILEKPAMGAFEVNIAWLLSHFMGRHVLENRLGRVITELLF